MYDESKTSSPGGPEAAADITRAQHFIGAGWRIVNKLVCYDSSDENLVKFTYSNKQDSFLETASPARNVITGTQMQLLPGGKWQRPDGCR